MDHGNKTVTYGQYVLEKITTGLLDVRFSMVSFALISRNLVGFIVKEPFCFPFYLQPEFLRSSNE